MFKRDLEKIERDIEKLRFIGLELKEELAEIEAAGERKKLQMQNIDHLDRELTKEKENL